LHRTFGDAVVLEGDNYPAPAAKQMVATALQFSMYGALALLFVAPNMLPPQVRAIAQENRMMAVAGFFLINSVAGMLVQTGAFEVTVDGRTVFSKLETGQAPNLGQIIQLVADELKRNNLQQ
jgi:selT/selW/selH-like putative selenoprotein